MNKILRNSLYLPFFMIMGISSCSIPKVMVKTKIEDLPQEYISPSADTNSLAKLSINDFFQDEHLTDLIHLSFKDNADYNISLKRIEIASTYLGMSKSSLFPAIHALLRSSRTRFGKYTMEGVGNFDTNLSGNIEEDQKVNTNLTPDYWMGLNASWEIDIWGRLRQMKRAAQYRYFATEEGKRLISSTLSYQIAYLYYELISLDKEISILEENINLQQKALEIIRVQRSIGRATELAVKQFEAQTANSSTELIKAKQELVATENAIRALTGNFAIEIKRKNTYPIKSQNVLNKPGNPAQILEYRPDVKHSFLALQATNADAKAARAAFFPQVNLSAYAAINSFSGNTLFNVGSFAWQIFGGLTAPIFQQKQIRGNFNIARANQEIAYWEYRNAIVNAYTEINTVLKQLEAYQQMINLKSEEVQTLDDAVAIANDLYIAGYANYLEIIAAQKNKLEADINFVKMQKEQTHAMVFLYKALGGGR